MKRRELLAGMAALGVAGPVQARPLMPLHEKPREMLSPPFVDGKGRDLTLADFRGRVVLLNIWATWCVPCREEMPTLDALQEKMGGGDFHVLPLSIDRAGMKIVRRFYDEIGLRHLDTYLAEDIRVMAAFAVVGLPTTGRPNGTVQRSWPRFRISSTKGVNNQCLKLHLTLRIRWHAHGGHNLDSAA